MNTIKRVPVGITDFKKIIEQNYYYVDKTKLIEDILKEGNDATLITRPRRFGKSLNMDMLKVFFEDKRDRFANPISTQHLFNNLYISNTEYMAEQGKYPVINLTFKKCNGLSWEHILDCIKIEIQKEFKRHKYAFSVDMETYNAYIHDKGLNLANWENSLEVLTEILSEYHNNNCIIILDEYDVPLRDAYTCNEFEVAINFFRNFFQAFKGNYNLQYAVVAGCLRISKESIFTGWNNARVCNINGNSLLSYFGLTNKEVKDLLGYYDLQGYYEEIKEWYNGYNFNGIEIYNPWEVMSYVQDRRLNMETSPKTYWANTSSNEILKELMTLQNEDVRYNIDLLLKGYSIRKTITENVTYNLLENNKQNLWSILYYSGYLTGKLVKDNKYSLRIPNKSVRVCYEMELLSYITERLDDNFVTRLDRCFINNDAVGLEKELNLFTQSKLTNYDTVESFYHGFIICLLGVLDNRYDIKSNLDIGDGRADVVMNSTRQGNLSVILELKYSSSITETALRNKAEEGYNQIINKKYDIFQSLANTKVHRFGIAFHKKNCAVYGDYNKNKKE